MNSALLASAALMGLAGSLHCAGMCGAVCAGVAGRCTPERPARGTVGVLAGRLLGYMLAGAAIAGFASGLRWLGEGVSWLRPFWSAAQVGLLLLGLWLLLRGRLPLAVQAWIEGLGRRPKDPAGWQRIALPGELRAAGLGLLWPAIPCGLLHAALLLASVASGPLDGAAVMATFGLASSLGLLIGPAVWLRWLPGVLRPAAGSDASQLAVRLAGAMLVASLGWSLGHGLFQPLQDAFCL